MPLAADAIALMRETITLEPWSTQDGYGKPTYGASVTYRARVVGRNRMVRDDRGQEVVSAKQVYLDRKVTVTTKDRITLPSGNTPSQPPILAAHDSADELGYSATVLYLGSGEVR